MSRTAMQTYNLLLLTMGIILGIAVTVILILWIWVPDFAETGGRSLGTIGVVLAAVLLNWAVNAIFGSNMKNLLPVICYVASLLCIYAGVVLCIVAIWGNATTDFMLRAIGTLVVLFLASMVALGISAIVQASHGVRSEPPPSGD